MPTDKEVVGLEQTLQVLKKVHRIVYDQMNKEIKVVLAEIRDDAQGFAPSTTPPGLSNWAKQAPGTVWERLIFDPVCNIDVLLTSGNNLFNFFMLLAIFSVVFVLFLGHSLHSSGFYPD